MSQITSVIPRVLYNSRGVQSVEVDIKTDDNFVGRSCAPSGASVGIHEALALPKGGAQEAVNQIAKNSKELVGIQVSDLAAVHAGLRKIDHTREWSKIGGSVAYAVTIAATEAAAYSAGKEFYEMISSNSTPKFPYPIGNILGGGAHAGPGTPDIQEILVCPIGATTIQEAIKINFAVHKELGIVLRERDTGFTNGRGDEGGWAPRLDNEEALELAARACERLGYTLGKEVALGVDFASSTQWDTNRGAYNYARTGEVHTPTQQIEFVTSLIEKYNLIYVEDAVHEEAFSEMAELVKKFPKILITGDDLTVTSPEIIERIAKEKSCNATILKVNQVGSLYDALRFASIATSSKISLVTSHRSGESTDAHISHIAIATNSKMIKTGVLGGERIAKLNELLRLSEHGLIQGMRELEI